MKGLEHWDKIIDQFPVLDWQDQVELARIRDEGGKRGDEALEKLILHNLRAVATHVERMNARPDLKHDLFSAGVLGLRKAAAKWQPIQKVGFDRPAPFTTYAFLWIREAVIKEARATWHDDLSLDEIKGDDDEALESIYGATEDDHLHLSAEVLDGLTPAQRTILEARLIDVDGRSDEELGAALGIKPESVSRLLLKGVRYLMARAS